MHSKIRNYRKARSTYTSSGGNFDHVPTPRAIDVLKTLKMAYLLMTRVPDRPIGLMIYTMIDEQMKQAMADLK
ncbi:hypothetical protein ACJ73_02641 [Blastomyces percursus]|uniref:Uncharacterized protein n=1 Tax=Blastomyces percursus TaxID=1658174 RepID=A0A1J9QAW9_9EURO|nr:hypothetical protein ACJ73_02641 [Blastomyces percursus]